MSRMWMKRARGIIEKRRAVLIGCINQRISRPWVGAATRVAGAPITDVRVNSETVESGRPVRTCVVLFWSGISERFVRACCVVQELRYIIWTM